MAFVSGGQARAGSSMVCIDVHYSNFRALSRILK